MHSANDRYETLIMRFLDGQCSAEEARELLSWVADSEDNRLRFKSLKEQHEVWSLTGFAMPEEVDVEAALDAVNAKIDAIEEAKASRIVELPWLRRNYRYVTGVAAALVVALFVGFLVAKPFRPAVTLAFNGTEQESSYTLPDGTAVTFKDEGNLNYGKRFGKEERNVNFEGIADFDVAKDATRPFIIHCDKMDVEVLGTRFLLKADKSSGRYTVDLYTGQVRMTAFDKKGAEVSSAEVLPGGRGVWNAGESEIKTMTYAEVKEEGLKLNHVLEFNDETLAKIVEALEHIYKVDIDLADACASKKLTARFSDEESIDNVFEAIALATSVTVTKVGEVYQIR